MNLQELREKLAAALAEAEAITTAAKAENREITDEEETKVESFLAEVKDLDEKIKAKERKLGIASRLDAAKAGTPATVAKHGPVTVEQNSAKDEKHGFRNLGEYATAVMNAHSPGGSRDERLVIGAAASGNNQKVGPDGGFLVPPSFASTIWDGLHSAPNSLLSMVDRWTVEGESLEIPANAETSRATGSRYGGVQGYWIDEADQIPTSKPTFRKLRLEPKELAVMCFATNKLLRNSPVALEQYLSKAATEEIDFMVGDAIINGNGVGKPRGILNSGALVAVAKEGSQAADTIVEANIHKMWARLHARSRANAVWLINQDIEPQLQLLKTDTTIGWPLWMPEGGLRDAPFQTLKGRPVIPVEYCATLGDQGDIILADMSGYAAGLKQSVEYATSMHLRFDYAEQAFRFMFAVDGQTYLANPLTPFKGSATQSQFITLAART